MYRKTGGVCMNNRSAICPAFSSKEVERLGEAALFSLLFCSVSLEEKEELIQRPRHTLRVQSHINRLTFAHSMCYLIQQLLPVH